jgi:hypothetical protein
MAASGTLPRTGIPARFPGRLTRRFLLKGVTVSVDADVTVGAIDLSNGTLAGSATLTVSGALIWTAGA